MRIAARRFSLALACVVGGSAACAEGGQFAIMLGSDKMGTLSYEDTAGNRTMTALLDNTPLGVADGQFVGTSSGSKSQRSYRSETSKRVISFDLLDGAARNVSVAPQSEATELSDASVAPGGLTDPATALLYMVQSGPCPAPFRIYDGRRAIAVTEAGRTTTGNQTTCNMRYTVTHGPGHLSPFRFSNITLDLTYGPGNDGPQTLLAMTAGAGIFTLNFSR